MGNQERVIAVLGAGGSLGAAISHQLAGEAVAGLVLSDISGPSLEATIDGMPRERSFRSKPHSLTSATLIRSKQWSRSPLNASAASTC